MADDKQFPLTIILRTVDKATAGIQAVNERLDEMTKPTREFGKALKELGEKSGFNAVMEGFKGTGEAVKESLFKVLELGATIGEATHLVLEMIEGFSKLHDTAIRLGTTEDFLAEVGFAASKSGSSVDALTEGLSTLTQNLGQAKAGTGKMLEFLKKISPEFAKQVTNANSMEEALGLLADAAAKLPDAARRAALAQKTLGDRALAPLLARGAEGIQELMAEYFKLAGAQGEAGEAAAKVDDVLKELHASTDGVKAALVVGLAPALKVVIEDMTHWLVDHREDIRQWAEDIGKKLPGAVDDVVSAVKKAVRWIGDIISDIGGWKVAMLGVAAVMVGPLVSAITTLGIAMLATPFGQIVLGLAAVTAGVVELIGFVKNLGDAFDTTHEKMLEDVAILPPELFRAKYPQLADSNTAAAAIDELAHPAAPLAAPQRPWLMPQAFGPTVGPGMGSAAPQASLKVDFVNAPRGMRVTADPRSPIDIDLGVGYQMGGM